MEAVFLYIPCSAIVWAEAVSKSGCEHIPVSAQKLVYAHKLIALLGQRVNSAQNGWNGRILSIVQQDNIAVAGVIYKPV